MSDDAASDDSEGPAPEGLFSAERAKAFIDAVVAIAMTLLILPLMEAATGITGQKVAPWLNEHGQQLQSFVLSFAIIAMFWINHHRIFARVHLISIPLLWINMAWLLSIVWLPVATALSGEAHTTDSVVKIVYIGTMIVTCLLTLALRLFLGAHPLLHDIPADHLKSGIAVDISMVVLFAVALGIAIAFPFLSYYPLFVMFLIGPLQAVLARMLGVPKPPKKTKKPHASGVDPRQSA
ncbi:MAG: TMEM175 family protein [Humibacter sp.]